MKLFAVILISIFLSNLIFADEYEDNIKFTVFNSDTEESFVSTFDTPLSAQGCDGAKKFALFTHGWMGSSAGWIEPFNGNLSLFRGGCIIFMNYSHYADDIDYFRLVSRFEDISRVMVKKLNQLREEGVTGDQIYMFGFSYGGRLVIESGIQFGKSEISAIDACDMAGPGFDYVYKKDPKEAAQNVQCIHTSLAGTQLRQCHQNWLMGYCGKAQPGGQGLQEIYCDIFGHCGYQPINSHSLCPYYYISAFTNNFTAYDRYHCPFLRTSESVPSDFNMGYNEDRKNPPIIGDFPSPTCKQYPYVFSECENEIKHDEYDEMHMH